MPGSLSSLRPSRLARTSKRLDGFPRPEAPSSACCASSFRLISVKSDTNIWISVGRSVSSKARISITKTWLINSRRIEEGLRREHRDFLYYILRQNEKGGVSQNEIILNSALFIVAGSETTASLLSGLIMWLTRTPHAYKKLTDEVRNNFASVDELTFLRLQELPYMNACIDEALRIFPPIPTGLTRTVPEGGDTVAGEFLPGGTTVSCHGWANTHSPDNFRQPDEFIPERWLDDAYASDKKEASQPFSLGPRGCIGKNLTYLELRLILGNLLWFYDLKRADLDDPNAVDIWDPSGDLKHVNAFNTWNKPPLMCTISHVKR